MATTKKILKLLIFGAILVTLSIAYRLLGPEKGKSTFSFISTAQADIPPPPPPPGCDSCGGGGIDGSTCDGSF